MVDFSQLKVSREIKIKKHKIPIDSDAEEVMTGANNERRRRSSSSFREKFVESVLDRELKELEKSKSNKKSCKNKHKSMSESWHSQESDYSKKSGSLSPSLSEYSLDDMEKSDDRSTIRKNKRKDAKKNIV